MADPSFSLVTSAPASGQYNDERGYYRYDPVDQTFGDATVYSWNTTGWFGAATPPVCEQYSPSCVYISEIGGVIPRPYWNFVSIPFSTNWRYFPVNAVIEDISPGGTLLDSNLYHFARSDLTSFQGAMGNFRMPIEPAFMFHIRRHDLPYDWDWDTYEPVTIIYFGQWSLHIPYRRRARLRYRYWRSVPDIFDEFDLQMNRMSDAAGEETVDLTIMCLKGGVLFSTDYGQSWHFYQSTPDPDHWAVTLSYYPVIENLGGRFSFAFVPIDAPGRGMFVSKDESMGYSPDAGRPVAAGEVVDDYRLRWVDGYGERWAHDGYLIPMARPRELLGAIQVGTPSTVDTDHCQYLVTMTPKRHYISSLDCHMANFPQLFAVRLMAEPTTAKRVGGDASTINTDDVTEIQVDLSDDMGTNAAVVTLQNNDNYELRTGVYGYENIQEYEPWNLRLQGPDEASTTIVFYGFVLRVDPSVGENARWVRVELGSPWLRLKDYKCLETDPCLAGWYTEDAIEWYVNAAGLPASFTKHSNYNRRGRKLPSGLWGDRSWQAKPGATAADILEAIALYEGYEFYFDGEELQYEPRPASTQDVDWIFYASNSDAPGLGGVPELLMINPLVEALRDPEDHRNEIIVIGQDRGTGDYLIARNIDTTQTGPSATEVGHRKMLMVVDPEYDTQGIVQRVARQLYDKYSGWPPRRVRATVLGRAAIKQKEAVKIYGDGLRSNESVFRIETVRHQFAHRHFTTEIEGVWIRDD